MSDFNFNFNRSDKRLKVRSPVGIDLLVCEIHMTEDIGPGGIFVETKTPLPKGARVISFVILPSRARAAIIGTVWRTTPNGIAIKFDEKSQQINSEVYSIVESEGGISHSYNPPLIEHGRLQIL